MMTTTLPLICSLYAQGALPALIFNYDRTMCEIICYELLNQPRDAEEILKSERQHWEDSEAKRKRRWLN